MNRRQFLSMLTVLLLSLRCGRVPLSIRETKTIPAIPLKDLFIIDAHAHPARMLKKGAVRQADCIAAFAPMKKPGAFASSFSAVGDKVRGSNFYDRIPASYDEITEELDRVKIIAQYTGARIVRESSDIPGLSHHENAVGILLALEGADPIEDAPHKIDDLYQQGVRIITLMHYRVNVFGDIMTAPAKHNKLTVEGRKLIEHMQRLGIVIDVAHSHMNTLRGITEMTCKPLIDSHTALSYALKPGMGRARTFKEMEMVAGTGGVVCTWLLAVTKTIPRRETFLDWAKEIRAIKERIGIEHVGLGTDTGGYLRGTKLIVGYRDITDLEKLAGAMLEVGLTKDDITAFMGGNMLRVLKTCIG